jgi:hypothetical protein
MEGLLLAYIIYYLFFLLPISIIYYRCIKYILLKGKEFRTVISVVVTILTIIIIIFFKFSLEAHFIKLEGFEPIYLEVLVIIIALIIYIFRKINIKQKN